jgi:hypothetical protein
MAHYAGKSSSLKAEDAQRMSHSDDDTSQEHGLSILRRVDVCVDATGGLFTSSEGSVATSERMSSSAVMVVGGNTLARQVKPLIARLTHKNPMN